MTSMPDVERGTGAGDAAREALRSVVIEENRDWVWLRRSRIGTGQLRDGCTRAALRVMVRTADATDRFGHGDPRRAASLNNAGMAHACIGDPDQAAVCYEAAIEAWDRAARDWTTSMRLGQRARSSLFHLRMERKHRARYDEMARADHRQALRAGALVSALNLADVRGRSGEPARALRECEAALTEAETRFGEDHALAALAREHRARLTDGVEDCVPVQRWGVLAGLQPPRPPAMSDEPRVTWALHWTLTTAFSQIAGERAPNG